MIAAPPAYPPFSALSDLAVLPPYHTLGLTIPASRLDKTFHPAAQPWLDKPFAVCGYIGTRQPASQAARAVENAATMSGRLSRRGVKFPHKHSSSNGHTAAEGRRLSFSDLSEDGSPTKSRGSTTLDNIAEVWLASRKMLK